MNWFNRQTKGLQVFVALAAAFLGVDLILYLIAPDQTLSHQVYLWGRDRPPVVFAFGCAVGAGAVLLAAHFWGWFDDPRSREQTPKPP